MKTATLTLIAAGLANVAVAQFGDLPSCANECLNAFSSGEIIAGCNKIDIKCICSNSDFLGSIACCLADSCSEADQKAAVQFAENICLTGGVTDLPPSVGCSTTSSGAPSSSSTGATPTGAASSSSTGGKPTGAATTSSPTTGATTSSNGTALSTKPSATTPTGTTAPPSSSTNAAPQNMAVMGAGLVGGLAVVAAFL